MNAVSKIVAAPPTIRPFNALAAYEAERKENRRIWEILSNVLFVAEAMIGEDEREGKDVTVRRAIVAKAREDRWAS